MRRTIRRYRLGYALSSALCFIGLVALLIVVWKVWPKMSSTADPTSTLWTLLWTEQLSLLPGIEFKLMYLMILAAATLSLATVVFAFSRQWFSLPGMMMRLQCPFCKKQWSARYDRGQVLCPHCNHLVHPRMVE